MDAIVILGIAVLCGVIYLIGHAHGKTAAPTSTTVVLGGAGAGTPAALATDPNNNPQIKG